MERGKRPEEIKIGDLENGAVVVLRTRMFGGLLEVPWEGVGSYAINFPAIARAFLLK